MKNKRYYEGRAAYMRELAKSAQTDALKISCLKAAEAYDILAANVDKAGALAAPDQE